MFQDTFFNETVRGRTRQGKHRLLDLAQLTADSVTAPSEPLHIDINDTHTSEARKHKHLRALGSSFFLNSMTRCKIQTKG